MSRVLPVRQIASATGLSPSRDPREIPGGNCQRRRPNRPDEPRQEAAPSRGLPDLLTRWPSSSRCREWLERLDCGELVGVNLRPETDPETEYVSFDRPRVLWVLSHIIADLDELAGYPSIADEEQATVEDPKARRARHRRRLARARPTPKRLSDRANRKNGRPYRPLWAFRRMSGGEPDTRGNRDRALPVSGRSRKRSVK